LAGGFVDGEQLLKSRPAPPFSAVGRLLSFGQGADADESFRLSQSGAHLPVRL